MRDIVVRLEGEERVCYCHIESQMMALQSGSCNDMALYEATALVEQHDEMWREIRKRFDLEDEEQYLLDRSIGVIFVDSEE